MDIKSIENCSVENQLAGEHCYNNTLLSIMEKIKESEAQTLEGKQILSSVYDVINESTNNTPFLSIKPFLTGAEKVASADATLKDVVDFIKKNTNLGDLNFLINLCKEEHYANLNKSGIPAPEETIKSIKEEFKKNGDALIDSIKKGIFDDLKSETLPLLKEKLGMSQKTKKDLATGEADLSEGISPMSYNYGADRVLTYNPVGINLYDEDSDTNTIATMGIFIRVNEGGKMTVVQPDTEYDSETMALINAINNVQYDPETSSFYLSHPTFDFEIKMDRDGELYIRKLDEEFSPMNADDLEGFIIESFDEFRNTNPDFDVQTANRLADAFITIAMNSDLLIELDNIIVVENVESRKYALIDVNVLPNYPDILYENTGLTATSNREFTTYAEMKAFLSQQIGIDFVYANKLVEEEAKMVAEHQNRVMQQQAQMTELNKEFDKVQNLKRVAEQGSQYMNQVIEAENTINDKIKELIQKQKDEQDFAKDMYIKARHQ